MSVLGWQDRGACHDGVSWVLFYSADGERPAEREVREAAAKEMCAGCPVLDECLEYALDHPEKWGIWGQMNEDERESARQERQQRERAA
jgi:WhiB family redox-sensing transcriptional regulator